MTQPLALGFPLFASRLIEASAGTGKTYTISALYLRLILQHGGLDNAFKQALLPPQILVVTFTDAATRELRDRIRVRLVEAAQAFRGDLSEADALLQALVADYPAEQHAQAARLLEVAAQWMDEAAVSTIHSWCQRMLREHAFDSNSLFQQQLETDQSELLNQVACDYWRQQCYPLTNDALQWVIKNWQEPEKLLQQLYPLMGLHEQTITPIAESLAQRLTHQQTAFQQLVAELKQPWLKWCDELEQAFDAAVATKAVDGRKLSAKNYSKWLEQIRQWASSEQTEELQLTSSAFKRLSTEGIFEAWKDTSQAFSHPALEQLGQIPEQIKNAQYSLQKQALRHAQTWIELRFEQEKQVRAQMGFDDMLKRLDQALQGENGERLAAVIRQQFPIAMIDEFQDTDPLQYRIFDQIYKVGSASRDTGLFLIGDPKQAIYSFRGADIFTYLKARKACNDLYELDTNFRSSQGMVESVNYLFAQAEAQEQGKGAFLFKDPASAENQLPFLAVKANGRQQVWQIQQQAAPALTLHYLAQDEPLSAGAYRQQMAQSCASQIVQLLNQGAQQQSGFYHESEGFTPVKPSDIAILVRNFNEAQAIRNELSKRNVRSVYLSDKDSVFESAQAKDILLCLKACSAPNQERPVKAALASALFCRSLPELEAFNLDENLWEDQVMQFRRYQQIWQWQGVLPMLRQLLHDYHLAERLTQQAQGERALTNILHLAELLQQASIELDGDLALIRYLEQAINGEINVGDEQVLRLESDEALVRVITIHKSKGLEYPLVFLPFICSGRSIDPSKAYQYHDGQQRQLALLGDDQHYAIAEQQRLAEDLRLLYVALTRARFACWLGLADLKDRSKASILHNTAIGYLLTQGNPLASSSYLVAALSRIAHPDFCQISIAPEATDSVYNEQALNLPAPICREALRSAKEHWWIASYSALRVGEKTQLAQKFSDEAPDSADAAILLDDEKPSPQTGFIPATKSIHNFPKGPKQGTFLHGLFELAADTGFAQFKQNPAPILAIIEHRMQLRDWQDWTPCLQAWFEQAIATPLNLGTNQASLAQISHYQSEMEFWFAAHKVNVQTIDRLVQQSILPHLARPRLEPAQLNGMFKGFIDLTFEHQGKYYILDYKSNWLGADASCYSQQAMQDMMLEHRYDLQYVFYVLALHRQLKLRLGTTYNYQQHIGGVVYWFVRGTEHAAHGVYFTLPEQQLIETLDALFSGNQQEALL